MALATATQVEVALRARYANLARPDERPTLRDAEAVFKQLREIFQLAYAFGVANRWNTPIIYDPGRTRRSGKGPSRPSRAFRSARSRSSPCCRTSLSEEARPER